MKVLAIETSTMLGGVAVMDSEKGLLAEARVSVRAALSERLMTAVDFVLGQSNLDLGNMDALAVSVGPGSFTGLRIGLGTVKGLAFATGLPVVAVPTLEAYAMCLPYCRYPICPMLDARKKEVYAAVFSHGEDGLRRILPERAVRAGDLAAMLTEYEAVVFVGQGAELYRREIEERMGPGALFAPPRLMTPSPAAVAEAGLARALRGEYSDPAALSPFYIRKSEAEIKAGRAIKASKENVDGNPHQ